MKNKVYARIIAGVMAVTMLVQTAVPSSATEINNLKSDANETQDATSSDDQEEEDLLNTTLNLDNYDQEDTTTYLNIQLTREKGFPEGVTGSVSALSDEDTEKLAEKDRIISAYQLLARHTPIAQIAAETGLTEEAIRAL